jgi:hypothetical protein
MFETIRLVFPSTLSWFACSCVVINMYFRGIYVRYYDCISKL